MQINILVIDDSAVMRAMVIKILRMSGLTIETLHQAENGREALNILSEYTVDLALLDLNMPEMNGEEFLEKVRKNRRIRNLKVMVVSTESSETRIRRLREMDAEFIHKPFTPEQLREKIVTMMGVCDERTVADASYSDGGADF